MDFTSKLESEEIERKEKGTSSSGGDVLLLL